MYPIHWFQSFVAKYYVVATLKNSTLMTPTHIWMGIFTVILPLIMKKVYVTGFWKTDQDVTLGLFHLIGPAKQLHSYITHLLWALLVLVDWSAFLEQVFPAMLSHD